MNEIKQEVVRVERVMSVYDSKAEIFLKPFTVRTFGEAERNFRQVANDENTNIGLYPEDFTLFHVGDWDSCKGKMIELTAIKSLGTAINYVTPKENKDQEKLQLA